MQFISGCGERAGWGPRLSALSPPEFVPGSSFTTPPFIGNGLIVKATHPTECRGASMTRPTLASSAILMLAAGSTAIAGPIGFVPGSWSTNASSPQWSTTTDGLGQITELGLLGHSANGTDVTFGGS